ncbi:hypothetical protein GMRT_24688 [Giardia muris]|uniref:EF-hand domain-containing protein n=1 Tax=Giardia muris TaxID=5742 RepID=A0A4Z1SNH8_GIAMU|nr:hypothetical protein GMRT_24688 [Giardia muris]|eukprot:TNJ26425.1 hypothetical protein GMRT_24688 [Giardia muris]
MIGRFQEWYKSVCSHDQRIDAVRFFAVMNEFCFPSEPRLAQLFQFFDFYRGGRIDVTDFYLLTSLLLASALNMRIIFLYQHQNNIISYIQDCPGNLVKVSGLVELAQCAGVGQHTLSRVLQRLSKHFNVNTATVTAAVNFLFACFLEQDRLETSGCLPYAAIV